MRAAALSSLVLLLAVPTAGAASERAADVAAALGRDPVYVAPARRSRLDAAAAGRLRLRIVDRDLGRIKIAVVPRSWADADGGVAGLARGVDEELRAKGALLVVADGSAFVVTSHRHATDAATAVQRAFDRPGSLEDHLRRSVDALAEVDPGAPGDVGGPPPPAQGEPAPVDRIDLPNIAKTVDDGIKLTFLIILAVILAPFLVGGFALWRRARRASEESEESLEDARADAAAQRDALGQDIVDLDEATSGADVPAGARAAYERALDAYERSELALENADSPRRVQAAAALIAKGRADAATAREAAGPGG